MIGALDLWRRVTGGDCSRGRGGRGAAEASAAPSPNHAAAAAAAAAGAGRGASAFHGENLRLARGAHHILERPATQIPLVTRGAEHVARQAAPVPSPRRLVWLNLVKGAPIVWTRAADEGAPPLVCGNWLVLCALQRPSLEVLTVASVAQHAPRQEIPVTSPRSLTGFHAMESCALVGAVATSVSTAKLPAKSFRDGGKIPGRGGA